MGCCARSLCITGESRLLMERTLELLRGMMVAAATDGPSVFRGRHSMLGESSPAARSCSPHGQLRSASFKAWVLECQGSSHGASGGASRGATAMSTQWHCTISTGAAPHRLLRSTVILEHPESSHPSQGASPGAMGNRLFRIALHYQPRCSSRILRYCSHTRVARPRDVSDVELLASRLPACQ